MKKIIFTGLLLIAVTAKAQVADTIANYWQSVDGADTITDTVADKVADTVLIKATTKKIVMDTIIKKQSVSSDYRPELIVIGGGGYAQKFSRDGFGFTEAKLMVHLFNGLRIGPYGGYIQYSSHGTDKSKLLGQEIKAGLALDTYGLLSKTLSWYGWLNSGWQKSWDHYQGEPYESHTRTAMLFFGGGLCLSDGLNGWFSHNQLMFDYENPLGKASITAAWQGQAIKDAKAYDKKNYRLVLESGIKRFYVGRKSNVEPLIHLGYGRDYGNSQNYREYGFGFGFGFFKDWYRDIFKIKTYWRDKTSGSRINSEAVLNVTSLINILKK